MFTLSRLGGQAGWLNASFYLILVPVRTGAMKPPVRQNATAEAASFENAKSGPLQDRRFVSGCREGGGLETILGSLLTKARQFFKVTDYA